MSAHYTVVRATRGHHRLLAAAAAAADLSSVHPNTVRSLLDYELRSLVNNE